MKEKLITLIDCEKIHKEHPDTFEIPSSEDIASITIGSLVKLIFVDNENGEGGIPERMWVIVESIDNNGYAGRLNSNPMLMPIKYGDQISFARKHICQIYSRKRILVTQCREFKRHFMVDVPANVDPNDEVVMQHMSKEADVRGVTWIKCQPQVQAVEVQQNEMLPIEPLEDVPVLFWDA